MRSDKIIIVGGGSSGWMTASTLIKAHPNKDISVIESSNIPVSGVGESTLAKIRYWIKFLEIDDKDFLRYTDGIYKLSIKFTDFYKKGDAFHYPFGNCCVDGNNSKLNDWWFKKELYPETPNSDYADCNYPIMSLVNNNKMTYESFDGFQFDKDTSFHFDAIKFGQWLKENYCLPRGVKYINEDIVNIDHDENGIKSINGKYKADLYIDCSGFKSLLLDKTLNEPFESWEDILPNNSAWAAKVPYKDKEKELKPYTNCTAIENGWVWNIPLWNRVGTGYVYSNKFVDDDTALQEFKNHLNRDDIEDLEFKNIKMRTGIHRRLFVKNVVAVGLSAGFIEPLESNGLFSVHEFLIQLVRNLRRERITQWDKDNYTFACKSIFTSFAEFVCLHYALSNREDTEYWKMNSDKQWEESLINLKPKLNSGGFVDAALRRYELFEFPNNGTGLHAISAGMNWAPTDIHTLKYYNRINDKEVFNYFKPWVDRLNERKDKWNKNAETYLNYIDWMKENIYSSSYSDFKL